MTPEGKVKAWVKAALKANGIYWFMPVQNGMGAPSLDLLTCWRGYFVAIETKVPGKKLTGRQWSTARQIADHGGVVFVVRTKDDIAEMIRIMSGDGLGSFVSLGCIYDELGPPDDDQCEGVTTEPSSGGA